MKAPRIAVRFDKRTLIGVGLAVAAGLLVILLTRPEPTVAVVVAEGPLPAGVDLGSLPVGLREVEDAGGLLKAESVAGLAGWTLAAPLAEGEPVVPSLLRAPERKEQPDVIALSLDRDRAVLGELQAGDLVNMYVTVESPGQPPVARLVAAGVYVVTASAAPGGIAGSERIDLLLAVDDRLAEAVVSARHEGQIDLVRVAR